MTVGEVRKQSRRNSRLNISHNLGGRKTKPSSNQTFTHKHTTEKSIYNNTRASKLVKLKSQKTIQP